MSRAAALPITYLIGRSRPIAEFVGASESQCKNRWKDLMREKLKHLRPKKFNETVNALADMKREDDQDNNLTFEDDLALWDDKHGRRFCCSSVQGELHHRVVGKG